MRKIISLVFLFVLLTGFFASLTGCGATTTKRYKEYRYIKNLTVVYADPITIQEEYEYYSKKKKRVEGFALLNMKIMYCSKPKGVLDKASFEICGHELFHMTHGKFHAGIWYPEIVGFPGPDEDYNDRYEIKEF